MKDKWLLLLYLLLHTILCSTLLYLLVESLTQASSGIAILLFISANLLFALLLLSPRLSLRLIWAICAFLLLYLLQQGLSDFFASQVASQQAISILYHILQTEMSLVLASLFLFSSALALRFGKYRNIEAVILLFFVFVLLTRDELSLSFENRYSWYRFLWLTVPALNLALLGLTLHPYLRGETSWLPSGAERNELFRIVSARSGKRIASFLLLFLILFAVLWWTRISPINWNQARRGSGAGNGLLEKNLSNQFDFGEYLRLDSTLEQNRQLVMMSRMENLKEDRPYYLTRFTLGGLDTRRSFFRDPQEPNMPGESLLPLELESGTTMFQMPRYDLRQNREMYVFLLNIKPSSLFVLNYPTEVQTFENWPDSSFSRVYQVRARTLEDPFPFSEASYSEFVPEDRFAYYTYVPESYADIGTLAQELLAPLPHFKPLQAAQFITEYFHKEYRYTLNPGIAEDGDQLRYFLFQSKKGYCTYFAFSAALMLRSLGIPTRVAVGFLLNPELRILDYYPLFADQAHAWIEVFEPRQGWVTFDPTTFELAPGEKLEFGLPEGAEADLAAL
ncbi:MAG: transglutaminase-like domain-containing protein, partial [Spirochaetota bacterium]